MDKIKYIRPRTELVDYEVLSSNTVKVVFPEGEMIITRGNFEKYYVSESDQKIKVTLKGDTNDADYVTDTYETTLGHFLKVDKPVLDVIMGISYGLEFSSYTKEDAKLLIDKSLEVGFNDEQYFKDKIEEILEESKKIDIDKLNYWDKRKNFFKNINSQETKEEKIEFIKYSAYIVSEMFEGWLCLYHGEQSAHSLESVEFEFI